MHMDWLLLVLVSFLASIDGRMHGYLVSFIFKE
jgi:hypothetical protein